MRNFAVLALTGLVLVGLALAAGHWYARPKPVTPNAAPVPPPDGALRVYHLGHSLVGRDMPAMLAQLAVAAGHANHAFDSQLGWGTPLRTHWYPDAGIAGFETENNHPRFRPAHEAIASGEYDAVILTEMLGLRDAIRYHDSPTYFREWARAARQARPDVRVYLYETWHPYEGRDAWLAALDTDPAALWQGRVLAPSWADEGLGPVHVIPAGRVLAAFTRALNDTGGLPGMTDETALFERNEAGALDNIHLNDQGSYLVALTHFAVLYQRPVEGLPHALLRADGSAADSPSPQAAALMQRVVWQVVSTTPFTGINGEPGA